MNRTALFAATLSGILSAAALAQTPAPRDPSSTRGRPDAEYPNKSGADTRTDAAARAHEDKGHDHPGDRNKVDPTPSAGPSGEQRAYTGVPPGATAPVPK